MPRAFRIIDLWAAALFVAATGALGWFLVVRDPKSPQPPVTSDPIRRAPPMTELTATWKDADGITHMVRSVQQDGEAWADFMARHQTAVAAMKAAYPPA